MSGILQRIREEGFGPGVTGMFGNDRRMTVEFGVNKEQYKRLCALRDALQAQGYENYPDPETVMNTMMVSGSYSLINERLFAWEVELGLRKK